MTELEELKAAVRRFLAAEDALMAASVAAMDVDHYYACHHEYEQAYNALCELAEKD